MATVMGCTLELARIRGKVKLFQAKMKDSRAAATMPGLTRGISILKKI